MADYPKHFAVNWIDGMKINKSHLIAQDDAWKDALQDIGSLSTSPIRFGVLPTHSPDDSNFNVKMSLDNQNVLRVSVLACQAVTPGGIRISISASNNTLNGSSDGVPASSFSFKEDRKESNWWIALIVNPYEKQPAGNPDLSENPPRYPFVIPSYRVEVINEAEYNQFAYHPYAIIIGKLAVSGNSIKVDNDYIPPTYSISALPDLVNLHAELDQFMSRLELLCSLIVQKIYQRNQQNDISELVKFLCDRIMIYLSHVITDMRWKMIHDSPAALFCCLAGLGRTMKNSIDLRIGSGKEEMLNYLTDWCELRQGELESMLANLANIRFDNNDINTSIQKVTPFVKVTTRLFETLNKLEFIGKRKDSGIFVKEESIAKVEQADARANRRRFLG